MKPFITILTPFKIWKQQEAARLRISIRALEMRLHRGRHPLPRHRQHGPTGRICKVIEQRPPPL